MITFLFRCVFTEWWPGQWGTCSFRVRWGENLEAAIGGELLGINEIWNRWYGQHRRSSRWCYNCRSLLETGDTNRYTHHLLFMLNMCNARYLMWMISYRIDGNESIGLSNIKSHRTWMARVCLRSSFHFYDLENIRTDWDENNAFTSLFLEFLNQPLLTYGICKHRNRSRFTNQKGLTNLIHNLSYFLLCFLMVPTRNSENFDPACCSLLMKRFSGCTLTWLAPSGMTRNALLLDSVFLLWWSGLWRTPLRRVYFICH